MSDLKISQLAAASPLTGTELIPAVQAGVNVAILAASLGIATFFPAKSFGAVGDGVTNDTAAIVAASNAAAAAGGGIVLLQGKTYFVPGGVPAQTNVFIVGVGAQTSLDNNYQRAGGTWFLGNNTAPGYFANNTPLLVPGGSQLSFATIVATGLRNCGNIGMGFDGYTAGHYIGELGSPGIIDGAVFDDLICINFSVGGFIHENVVYALFRNLRCYRPLAGARVGYQNWVSCTNYNFGNCSHDQILAGMGYGGLASTNARNVSFLGRAGAVHNHIACKMAQGTGGDALIACNATSVNAATAIAINAGQAVNLPLDMPVVFSTSSTTPTQGTGWGAFPLATGSSTTNGLAAFFIVPFMLSANITAVATTFSLASAFTGTTGTYSVKFFLADGTTASQNVALTNGSAGPYTITALGKAAWKQVQIFGTGGTKDYVQVALTMRGAAVAAGASASNFLVRWGFPLCEIAGYDLATDPYNGTANPSGIQSGDIGPLDLEGIATSLLFVQNANVNVRLNFLGGAGGQSTAYAARVCVRNAIGSLGGNVGVSYDAASSPAFLLNGIPLTSTATDATTVVQTPLAGVTADLTTGMVRLTLGPLGAGRGSFTPHQGQVGGTANFTYPEQPIGQYLQAYTGAGFAFTDAVSGGCVSLTNAGATTYTLPNIDSTTPGTQPLNYSWVGSPWEFANCNQPAGTNMTIKTNNVNQCFNQQNTGNAGTAINTCTLTPGSSISLVAHYDIRTATAFWFVRGNNGGTFSHT